MIFRLYNLNGRIIKKKGHADVVRGKGEVNMKKVDFNEIKGFICDMDGVIYHGNRLLPGAADFVNWLRQNNKEFLFYNR